MKKDKLIEIPLFDREGLLEDYMRVLSRKDKYLAERLKFAGLPTEGHCRVSTTPGNILVHAPLYKDFSVKTLAVLLGNQDEFDPITLGGVLHLSGPDVWRVWRVWLMDIMREDQDAFIRYMWSDNGALATIENIHTDLHQSQERSGSTRDVTAQLKRLLPGLNLIRLAEEQRGRPEGTGLFKNVEEFRTSLQDVFTEFTERPSETEVIERLRVHPLCQHKTSNATFESQTRTLRDWIKKLGFTSFHNAWRDYLLSQKTGK